MKIALFTYSIGSGVAFFAMYLRSGGFLRSFFAAIAVTIIAFIPPAIAVPGLIHAPDESRRDLNTTWAHFGVHASWQRLNDPWQR